MAEKIIVRKHVVPEYGSRVLGEYTEKIGGYLGCPACIAVLA
jgi:hypothetical protein